MQSGQKTEASIVFSSVHLINTGKYTCRARNGARDLNADRVIVVEKAVHLYVRCKFFDALKFKNYSQKDK